MKLNKVLEVLGQVKGIGPNESQRNKFDDELILLWIDLEEHFGRKVDPTDDLIQRLRMLILWGWVEGYNRAKQDCSQQNGDSTV